MPGNVTCNWTACLRSFCAATARSAAFLRSASESMVKMLARLMLQLRIDLEARLGLLGDLIHRHAGGEFDQRHAADLAVDVEHAQVSDHHVDNTGAGERQIALVQQLSLIHI